MEGQAIPLELLGELRTTNSDAPDAAEWRRRLSEDGYLFLKRALNSDDVSAVRREVFGRLAEVDEIQQPAEAGIATGTSRRRELCDDLGKFWQSVSEGRALRHVSHGPAMRAVMHTIFGEPARPQDYIFLRPGVIGRATRLHYDHPFFARGSQRIHTVWTALGEIPVCEGPLVVVESSHRFTDLIERFVGVDYQSNNDPKVSLADAVELVRQRRTRLLTADFEPGDVIIFGMITMHGSLDNHSPRGRTRLSCDVRWQPASDDMDPRYVGPNPGGTTGAGYGELNGAKPLNEPWHIR